jgi:type III pantothenate kinase
LELPESVLGADTIHAIQSGVLWGYVSMVEGMLDKIHAELGKKTKVVATGGLSSVLHPLHKRFDEVKRHLTLDGLRLIHEIVNNG